MPKKPPEVTKLIKLKVCESIASGSTPHECRKDLYRLRGVTVHPRYCTGKRKFWFNINPNSLRADYELWICGDPGRWYLIPANALRQMYEHPKAYPDAHHAEIRVVSVDASTHKASYASPGVNLDLSPYLGAILK